MIFYHLFIFCRNSWDRGVWKRAQRLLSSHGFYLANLKYGAKMQSESGIIYLLSPSYFHILCTQSVCFRRMDVSECLLQGLDQGLPDQPVSPL